MLSCKDLIIGHQKKELIRNINLEVKGPGCVALLGGNGSGKTSLLKTLLGIHPMLSGQILVDGKNIKDLSDKERASKMAALFTPFPELFSFKVYDLVSLGRFGLKSNTYLNKQDKDLIVDVLKLLGLENIQNKFFGQLSDGQKKKVMMARALAQESHFLIMDEPLAFLDMPAQVEMIDIFSYLVKERNKTIIFSLHDWSYLELLKPRIWTIDRNREFSDISYQDFFDRNVAEKLFHYNEQRVSLDLESLKFKIKT